MRLIKRQYKLKVRNSGDVTTAYNINVGIPSEYNIMLMKDKMPFEYLEPGNGFEEHVVIHMQYSRKMKVICSREDENGDKSFNEQIRIIREIVCMKIKCLKIKNFRGYKGEVKIDFDDFTAFVGKNDIGKSSVLEALDIFFNDGKGIIKQDKDDINKQALVEGDTDIVITACFEELPERIIIDATNETSLAEEFLLNAEGQLEIEKKYPNAGSAKVFIKAYHPTNVQCNDLLSKSDKDLKKIIDDNGIECPDRTRNAVMRKTIWEHYQDGLQLGLIGIDITKGETKSICYCFRRT